MNTPGLLEAPAPPVDGTASPAIADIDELVTAFLTENRFAGVTVAASKHGRLVVSKAYGQADTDAAVPMRTTHRSRVGSTTKIFVTLCLLQLVEDGLVSLTTPVYTIHSGSSRARHGMTGAEYQREFARNSADGFRLTHVDGYGQGAQARFAAIWERGPGRASRARHGLTGAQYQQDFERNTEDGFRLVQVSAYGEGADTRFATRWERRPGPAWRARHGLTSAQYQQEVDRNSADGFRLVHVSGTGDGAGTRFAAIWERRPGPALRARHGLTAQQYQQEFEQNSRDGFRLVHVDGYGSGTDARFAAIWERRPGPAMRARHGLNAAQYQQEFDRNTGDGFRLVHVSGYGQGATARFAALWERDASVEPGVLRSRSYTQALVDRARRDSDDPIDRVEAETQRLLSWAASMQVRHLLSHTSGLIRSGNSARAAADLGMAIEDMTYEHTHLGVLNGAVSESGPFLFAPGTARRYSNHGFGLAGFLVSTLTGMSFADYLRQRVLRPAGLEHVVPYGTELGERDARRHVLSDGVPRPLPHTAATADMRLGLAAGGLAASAEDLVRLMCSLDGLSSVPDVIGERSVEVMDTVTFPSVDADQPLGWDQRSARGNSASLSKNGGLTGGAAYMRRFLPGYRSLSGTDLSDINVAVCVNQSGSTDPHVSLANEIARRCGAADIPGDFDLFKG